MSELYILGLINVTAPDVQPPCNEGPLTDRQRHSRLFRD